LNFSTSIKLHLSFARFFSITFLSNQSALKASKIFKVYNNERMPSHKDTPSVFSKIQQKNLPNIPQIKRQRPNPFPRQIKNSVAHQPFLTIFSTSRSVILTYCAIFEIGISSNHSAKTMSVLASFIKSFTSSISVC
jgi:hypothetical protein